MDIKTIKFEGISVLSDLCLHEKGSVYIMSIYGAPQEVKAISAALSDCRYLTVSGEDCELFRHTEYFYRFKGTSIGYGKMHGIVWVSGEISPWKDYILWRTPEEKHEAFVVALKQNKIPFIEEWLEDIEKLMLKYRLIIPLQGWGCSGYRIFWQEDAICDLIVDKIIMLKKQEVKEAA